ncbi:hypothetical protein pb186bvf_017485 [Paramecium bursaria]
MKKGLREQQWNLNQIAQISQIIYIHSLIFNNILLHHRLKIQTQIVDDLDKFYSDQWKYVNVNSYKQYENNFGINRYLQMIQDNLYIIDKRIETCYYKLCLILSQLNL